MSDIQIENYIDSDGVKVLGNKYNEVIRRLKAVLLKRKEKLYSNTLLEENEKQIVANIKEARGIQWVLDFIDICEQKNHNP